MREREEKKLLDSLRRRGLVGEAATLDDILSLTVEDMLSRRLQTVVFKKGMALSPLHSRQLIVHGHITVGGRVITIPGYEVPGAEQDTVVLIGGTGKAEAATEQAEAPAEQPAQAQ